VSVSVQLGAGGAEAWHCNVAGPQPAGQHDMHLSLSGKDWQQKATATKKIRKKFLYKTKRN
jgi:hypothetical protein